MCEQPQLVINGQIVSNGDFTANGPTSGIACVLAFFETTTQYPHLLILLILVTCRLVRILLTRDDGLEPAN